MYNLKLTKNMPQVTKCHQQSNISSGMFKQPKSRSVRKWHQMTGVLVAAAIVTSVKRKLSLIDSQKMKKSLDNFAPCHCCLVIEMK